MPGMVGGFGKRIEDLKMFFFLVI